MSQGQQELPYQLQEADHPEQADNPELEENHEQARIEDEPPSATAMFGIKSPEMLLGETRKMQKKTLDLFHEKVVQVLQRKQDSELKRTKKRIEEKLAAIKQLNQKISEYMIQVGIPCSEVAEFNFAMTQNWMLTKILSLKLKMLFKN